MDEDTFETLAASPVQQTLLGEALEHAFVGAVVWNDDRRYVAANAAATHLLGCTRAELLGSRVGDRGGPDALSTVQSVLDGSPARGRLMLQRESGDVPLEWVAFTTRAGGLPQYLGLFWSADAST